MSTCRYTSCHRLLPGVIIEIDWHDYLDREDPRDWDWGDVRAFVHDREVPMGGTGLDDILQGGWERDGRGAFGFHDEMMAQLQDDTDAALEARAEVTSLYDWLRPTRKARIELDGQHVECRVYDELTGLSGYGTGVDLETAATAAVVDWRRQLFEAYQRRDDQAFRQDAAAAVVDWQRNSAAEGRTA